MLLAIDFKAEYLVDIVFLIGLAIWAIIDGKKGFITCFFSFVSAIVCTLTVLFLSAPLLNMTGGLFGLEGWLKEGMGNWLSTVRPFDLDISTDGWRATLDTMSLPDFLKDAVLEEIAAYVGEIPAGTLLGQYVGSAIASFLATVLCGAVLFVVVKLLMLLLRGILNKVAQKSNFIARINVLGGILAGTFKAIAVASIVLAVLSLIPVEWITTFFNNTLILKGMYNNNPILTVFSWFVVA